MWENSRECGRINIMITILIRQMVIMLFLIIAGIYCRYKKIVTDIGKKTISNLIVNVVLPFNIIHAYMIEVDHDFWKTFLDVLIVTVLYQVMAFIIAKTFYFRVEKEKKCIYQYATICSNAGFIGNAVAESLYGQMGILYASIFLIPQRIMMWTAGISFFAKEDGKHAFKKILLHPCMIATYIGILILAFQIPVPYVCNSVIVSISNCCTALTMMYLGMVLYGVDIRKLLDWDQLRFALIRLIFIPAMVLIMCKVFSVDKLAAQVCVLLAGMPAGSTTAILATQYHKNEEEAAKCVCSSTVLSLVTTIMWGYLSFYIF